MLQTFENITIPELTVIQFPAQEMELPELAEAPCQESRRFLELFEKISGWKAQFNESPESLKHRKFTGSDTDLPSGNFSIVDMSEHWPAQKPTAHRGMCDELIGSFDEIMRELRETRVELAKSKSALAALAPQRFDTNDDLIHDTFIPRCQVDDFVIVESPEIHDSFVEDEDFEVIQELGAGRLVSVPFAGWAIEGSTGIMDNQYVDWRIDTEEKIVLSVGMIESDLGENDREVDVRIDPLTCEFELLGNSIENAFYLWESAKATFTPMQSPTLSGWLAKGDAIIASSIQLDIDQANQVIMGEKVTASTIAHRIKSLLARNQPLLVLRNE